MSDREELETATLLEKEFERMQTQLKEGQARELKVLGNPTKRRKTKGRIWKLQTQHKQAVASNNELEIQIQEVAKEIDRVKESRDKAESAHQRATGVSGSELASSPEGEIH